MTRIALIGWILCFAASVVAEQQAWTRHTIDDSSRGADGVRLADVNADGWLDIATGWEEGGVIRIYVNPGPAKASEKWPAVTVGAVKSPEDAVLVDLDGDGAMDVVSCCEGGTRTVFVHWAPTPPERYLDASHWKTLALPATAGKQMWMFAVPLDIDGQNGIDLIVGSKGDGASIGWLRSPKDPRDVGSWTYHAMRPAGWIMSLQLHDMDRDSDLDVLATDRKGNRRGLLWLENPGQNSEALASSWQEHPVGGEDREVMFLACGDLVQDGSMEIATAVKGHGVTWFQRDSDKPSDWLTHEIAMPDGCGSGKGVGIGDMDGDGRADIVYSCEHAVDGKSGLRWLSYRETVLDGAWKDHEISGSQGVKFDRLELLDLDGDGDLDVLTCEERDNLGVIWYENPAKDRRK